MAAALPRPPRMLVGRSGEGGERSGAGWRRGSGSFPGRGDSPPHQSCEPQTLSTCFSSNSRSDSAALASYRRGNSSGLILFSVKMAKVGAKREEKREQDVAGCPWMDPSRPPTLLSNGASTRP